MSVRLGTPLRLAVVVGVVVVVQLLHYQVRAMLEPADVALPDWDLEELPVDLQGWTGEVSELDERLFQRIGADVVADRVFKNREGAAVSAHTALFKDFDEAVVVHLPSRCYRAAGWEQRDLETRSLPVEGLPDIDVEVSTWQREGRRVKVLFWYQLGEHTVLNRFDLGKAQIALAGRDTWPAMVKVMLETSADQRQAADLRLLDVAGQIRQWLHEQSSAEQTVEEAPDKT
ncbi:MAG: exosortase C-terminal domain/associated protein EpsI [Thermoguttaceae bacterium]